jgi:hypothetical protein
MPTFVIRGKRRIVQRWQVAIEAVDAAAAAVAAVAAVTAPSAAIPVQYLGDELVAGTVQALTRVREVEDPT